MIPLATTTISVLRPPDADMDAEPYAGTEPADLITAAAGVKAVIDYPSGNTQLAGGEQVVWNFQLVCDPTDLRRLDMVRDETSDMRYRVVWVQIYPGDHVEAGLRFVEGET